jgi:hypothetical protein
MSLGLSRALLRRQFQSSNRRILLQRPASTTSEAASSAAKTVSDVASTTKDKIAPAASKASEGLTRVASQAGQYASQAGSAAGRMLGGIGGRTGRALGAVQGKSLADSMHILLYEPQPIVAGGDHWGSTLAILNVQCSIKANKARSHSSSHVLFSRCFGDGENHF